jgi:hypothetical protein
VDLLTLIPSVQLPIDDLTNRAIMLADVAGQVSLTERDLAELIRALRRNPNSSFGHDRIVCNFCRHNGLKLFYGLESISLR